MKKYIYIAAVALVASAACSKVETLDTTDDQKIAFEVAPYSAQTKADDGGLLKELEVELGVTSGQAFKSTAYINADNGAGSTNLSPFFATSPETISWDSTNTEWAPSRDYYWPKSPNSNIDFFSWYVYGTAGDPALTYNGTAATLAWTSKTIASKEDILFADIACHQTGNQTTYRHDGVTEGVPTLFHHALAQVRFTAKIKENCDKKADSKDAGNYTFWEVVLSDVNLASVFSTGTLSLTATVPTTKTTQAWTVPTGSVWTSPSNEIATNSAWFSTEYANGGNTPLELTAHYLNANAIADNYITVLPQTVTDNMKLTFKMTINTYYGADLASAKIAGAINTEVIPVTAFATDDATDAYDAAGILLNKLGTTPITAWEMNKKITYNIIIDPSTTTILYDPAVEDWVAESADVNIPKE